MELLRVPPFPLTLEYTGLPHNQDVVVTFATSRNTFIEDIEATTNGSGVVEFTLTERYSRYDGEYAVIVYEGNSNDKGDVLVMDTLRIVRPYIDSAAIAPVGQEDEYAKYERIARTMIDNIVGGFYYKNAVYDLQGTGTDKLVIGNRVNKVLKLIENNVLMYELGEADNAAEYTLNTDHTAIILYRNQEEDNMLNGKQLLPPLVSSDSYDWPQYRKAVFPNGYDYTVTVETGWPLVPQDIKEATTLIIEDMACNAPNYWSKYVERYQTKDFSIGFNKAIFAGTGNLIVDQILQRYFGETLYNNIRVL